MIETNNLHKKFGQLPVIKGINIHIGPSRITGLVGPNACGKTTLIKSILGLVIPDSGNIRVDGEDIAGKCSYRHKIGYLPQNPDYPTNLSIRELFHMMEDVREMKATTREELIDLFELTPHLLRPFALLSGGTKQKVGIVLAFMFNPKILILDEPTVGLDPIAVVRLKKLMKERAQQGAAVLLVSHIMSELEQLAHDTIFLLDGKILAAGSLASLLESTHTNHLEDAVVKLMEGNPS